MSQSRTAGGHAIAAARELSGAARHAAYAAGQAAVVARAAAPAGAGESAGRRECRWQRDQFPEEIRALVLGDQRVRNAICWRVFDG